MNLEKEFESVVREYKSNMYMICYMYAKDKDEANDFFQETLINLWKGFKQFRGESNINTWISRICINTCLSALRKNKKLGNTIPLNINLDILEEDGGQNQQLTQMHKLINKLGVLDKAFAIVWGFAFMVWVTISMYKQLIQTNMLEIAILSFVAAMGFGVWAICKYFLKLNELHQSISDLKEFEKE